MKRSSVRASSVRAYASHARPSYYVSKLQIFFTHSNSSTFSNPVEGITHRLRAGSRPCSLDGSYSPAGAQASRRHGDSGTTPLGGAGHRERLFSQQVRQLQTSGCANFGSTGATEESPLPRVPLSSHRCDFRSGARKACGRSWTACTWTRSRT